MTMNPDDTQLLRGYAETGDEAAFAELVRRHVDLVYSVARRQVNGDTHLAEDVVTTVFADLAAKAGTVARQRTVAGWLFVSTRFAAAKIVRGEQRRRAREREALLMKTNPSDERDEAWAQVRPVLDEAIAQLGVEDREAILLRFFEGRGFGEVGERLQLTENTARMRVARALDKLHALLARRGVFSTTAALATALANQAVTAAPAGLAALATSAGLTAGATSGSGWLMLFMGKAKITGLVGLVAALAVGTVAYERSVIHRHEAALAAAAHDHEALQARVRELESSLAAEKARTQAADEDNGKLLSAVGQVQARPEKVAVPITKELVKARFQRAGSLAQRGENAEALREYLWCFDEGMPRVTSFGAVRRSFLLAYLADLGTRDPAALAALRERRDAAKQRLLASSEDFDAAADFSAINGYLKEQTSTLQLFDQLPEGDTRRMQIGGTIRDTLREAQRYREALEASPYAQMSGQFEIMQGRALQEENAAQPAVLREADRSYLVNSTVNDIEVLAGAGDLEHARALAERLLKFDASEATKARLQQQLTRAGLPELLADLK